MSAAEELYANFPDSVTFPPIECVVFGWGVNEDGQLGYEGEECSPTPRVIESLLGFRIRGRALGRNPLVAGSRNTLVISQEGMVWSWGWNDRGTLGRGGKSSGRSARPIVPFRNISIVQAAIGGWHCLAVDTQGRVYAWGGNEYMQCGLDVKTRDVIAPTQVVPELSVQQVACGGMHSLALTCDGDVWSWGEPWGEFSMSLEKTPQCVTDTKDAIMIACGAFHNMVLDRNGHVLTWGINDYGQLGNGGTNYSMTPTIVVDLDDAEIVDIAAGGWHSVAVSREGAVYVWGRGEYGRLGLGDTSGSSRLRPQKVPDLEHHRIVQASAGGTHTLCLTSEGLLFVWGRGSFGRLGDKESIKDRYEPHQVELPGGVRRWKVLAIACGGRHSLCLAQPSQQHASSCESTEEGGDPEEGDADDDDLSGNPRLSFPRHRQAYVCSLSPDNYTSVPEETMKASWGVDHEDDM